VTKDVWQHVGLYAYRRSFLLDFVRLERGPLESAERLEQLRALEHGHIIAVGVVEGWRSLPVDVLEDIPAVVEALRARGASELVAR
jgi:3-deoxy-manno-octulosonate cytidylyltransferase (CMP-KDO synthetase)